MSYCKTIRLLYAALPVRAWRGYLVRNHLEVCPRCQAELASREEAASVLAQARDLAGSAALWPGIRRKLAEKEGEKTSRIAIGSVIRQYAAGAAALLVTVLASLWLLRDIKQPRVLSPQNGGDIRFEIKYIRVGGETANAIIYQPQNSDAIFVWAGKNE